MTPVELEAKSVLVTLRNEEFLSRLADLFKQEVPGFEWSRITLLPNKFQQQTIKLKAITKLQEIYADSMSNTILSNVIFPSSTIIDKFAEMKEPIFSLATKYGKEYKSSVPQAKEFTDLFWAAIHDILDIPLEHMIFSNEKAPENG